MRITKELIGYTILSFILVGVFTSFTTFLITARLESSLLFGILFGLVGSIGTILGQTKTMKDINRKIFA